MNNEALARIDAAIRRFVDVDRPGRNVDAEPLLAALAEARALIPEPPTDDEREAIIAAVDEILNPFGVASSAQETLVLDAAQKWANRNRGPITEADVDLAYEAFVTGPTDAKASMRAALEAVEAAR